MYKVITENPIRTFHPEPKHLTVSPFVITLFFTRLKMPKMNIATNNETFRC